MKHGAALAAILLALSCKHAAPSPVTLPSEPAAPQTSAEAVALVEMEYLGAGSLEYPPELVSPDGRLTADPGRDECYIYEDAELVGTITRQAAEALGHAYPCDAWWDVDGSARASRDGSVVADFDDTSAWVSIGEHVKTLCERCDVVAVATAPDGNQVAMVRDGNLEIVDLVDGGEPLRLSIAAVVPKYDALGVTRATWTEWGITLLVPERHSYLPGCDTLEDDEVDEGVNCTWDETLERPYRTVDWHPGESLVASEAFMHESDDGADPMLNPADACVYHQVTVHGGRDNYSEWTGCELPQVNPDAWGRDYDDYSDDTEVEDGWWLLADAPYYVWETECEGCFPADVSNVLIKLPTLQHFELGSGGGEHLHSWDADIQGATRDGVLAAIESCNAPEDFDRDDTYDSDEDIDESLECRYDPPELERCDVQIRPDGKGRLLSCDDKDRIAVHLELPGGKRVTLGDDKAIRDTHWTRRNALIVTTTSEVQLREPKAGEIVARFPGAEIVPTTLAHELDRALLRTADALQLVELGKGEVVLDLERPPKKVYGAALDEAGKQLAFVSDDTLQIADVGTGKIVTRVEVSSVRRLGWRQDGKVLFGGMSDPKQAWTRDGEPTELPELLQRPGGDLDPSWRWIADGPSEMVRVLDGAALWFDDAGAVISGVGVFVGSPAALEGERYRAGPDPICDAVLDAADHPEIFERKTLIADFFAGKPLPTTVQVPADHPALISRCDP